MKRLGIDLGGTKIGGIVLDGDRETFRERVPTEQEQGYDHILDQVKRMYGMQVEHVGGASHTFGIGTPGAVSPATGLMKNSNTQCLNGKKLREDLAARLGRTVAIQNDANCFAMAEAVSGAGKGRDMVFGVIMGTGCGGGLVYRGEVITGPTAIAGEWGHTTIDPNGPECWCGSRGCVERFISGGGSEALYEKQTGKRKPHRDIVDAYRRGEKVEAEFMAEFFDAFGRALANIVNILDPDIIVLGGGLSRIDELYTTGVEKVAKYVFTDQFTTPVVKNTLGDSAGVIGAALIGI